MFARLFKRARPQTNDALDRLNEIKRAKTTMFARLFKRARSQTNDVIATLDRLDETLEMLEKKEAVLSKKAAAEVQKAQEFIRAKNKRAATQCLKKKRLYEQQVEQLGNFQLQMIMLEGAKATTETVAALRTGAAAMQVMQQATNINDVDRIMDDVNEQLDNMRQIQDALSAPIGSAADFDEDELEAELEELIQPATTVPAVPAGRVEALRMNTAEEDELAAFKTEMAL